MRYRELGRTGLEVSEIGFGAEWMTADNPQLARRMVEHAGEAGVNILDCWMADPGVRAGLGATVAPRRADWIVQGHFGSTWKDGQYFRTRDMAYVRPAWENMLESFGGHVELGMIHYVDALEDWRLIQEGAGEAAGYLDYVRAEKAAGHFDHLGLSTHNPDIALLAAEDPEIEMVMFSLNPAFDMLPASEDIEDLFIEPDAYGEGLSGIDPKRARLYARCAETGTGITVMKPLAGGRLLDASKSPFGVALTPVQCAAYCLNRPAVASVLAGYKDEAEMDAMLAYETAGEGERDYATALAGATAHAYAGACIYCGHCQPCVVGIDIAAVNKFADLALMHDEPPASVRSHYEALDAHAGDCIGCRTCEPRCPFGVHIAERMRRTAGLFGM